MASILRFDLQPTAKPKNVGTHIRPRAENSPATAAVPSAFVSYITAAGPKYEVAQRPKVLARISFTHSLLSEEWTPRPSGPIRGGCRASDQKKSGHASTHAANAT